MNENENFITQSDEYGNLILSEYMGNEKIVKVPEEIISFADDENLFCGNQDIEEIFLPENLVYIASYAFENCRNLKTVHLPNGLREINMGAFQNCTNLEKINFPARLKTIGPEAFKNCPQLKNISLPSKIQEISINSFDSTISLLEKNSAYKIEGGVMYNNVAGAALFAVSKNLSEVRIKKGTKSIAWLSFSSCKNLKSLSLPNGLSSIGRGAFLFCSELESIKFPAGLETIEADAFANCENLSFVKFKGSDAVKIKNAAFFNCPKLKEIFLPKNSVLEGECFDEECNVLFFKDSSKNFNFQKQE